MTNTLSWGVFLKCAKELLDICINCGEYWVMLGNDSREGEVYLVKKSEVLIKRKDFCLCKRKQCTCTLLHEENYLLKFEHHITYSLSYGVPVLSFNAWKSNGAMVTLEEAIQMVNPLYLQSNMLGAITQMDHPVLQKPFLTLHPCTTNDFISQFYHESKNPLITWLSSVGPAVHLNLPLRVLDSDINSYL